MAQADVESRPATAGHGSIGDAQAVALRIIAGLLTVGAAWLMAYLLVPFVLAMVLAIALSPLAGRLERWRVPRSLASMVCTMSVALVIFLAIGLVAYQAGSIASQADRYVDRFSVLLEKVTSGTGLDQVVDGAALGEQEGQTDRGGWRKSLGQGLSTIGQWAVQGVGGLLGVAGGGVIFIAALFYMLQTRDDWLERLQKAGWRLGLSPEDGRFRKVRDEIVTFASCLGLISLGYVVVVSLALWLLGVPHPVLWGVIAGLFEVVPYFGPLIAGMLPTLVSLGLGAWWKPVAVVGLFLALHLLEGYVVTPLLYGRAMHFDPVTVLFGALFFGWLWGPVGLVTAMPMMIILRGLLEMTPNTPALDALAEVDQKDS